MIDNTMKAAREKARKAKNVWYAWYPGDYASKTATLTLVEHGAYRVLLDHYYQMNGSMVANATLLLRACRAIDTVEQAAVHAMLARFFVERDGFYHHERADAELEKRALLREKRAQAGSKGGKQKVANATILPAGCQTQLQSQSPKKEEPEPTSEVVTSVSSNPEIQSPEEPLLVCEDRKPLPAIIPDPKPISSKINRGERWPSDAIVPDDWILEAAEYLRVNGLPQIDLKLSADTFQDYWPAQPGANGLKLDWRATWRNWVRNDAKRTKGYSNGKGQFGHGGTLGNHPGGKFAAIRERLSPDGEGRKTFDA